MIPTTVPPELDERFRAAAQELRLLDVGYDVLESPVGSLLVAASERGLVRISFADVHAPESTLEALARTVGPRVLRAAGSVTAAVRELGEYFAGRRDAFGLAVDLRGLPPFSLAVLGELARVPYGSTATYGELADRAGRPGAARAVGTVMNRNPVPIVLPCHRIVGASGSLVGYAGGLERKVELLRLEGALL
jgi:methylated-DNA-[protein]-cysteine S-methyltransferase